MTDIYRYSAVVESVTWHADDGPHRATVTLDVDAVTAGMLMIAGTVDLEVPRP